jgi:histidyl-tRNA synthetase
VGEEERAAGTVTVKDLHTGEQVVATTDGVGEELASRMQAGVT